MVVVYGLETRQLYLVVHAHADFGLLLQVIGHFLQNLNQAIAAERLDGDVLRPIRADGFQILFRFPVRRESQREALPELDLGELVGKDDDFEDVAPPLPL